MPPSLRLWILRADAAFLLVAGTGGFVSDLVGAFLMRGPQGRVMASAPFSALGFVEAHGLAVIVAFLLLGAASERRWHVAAAAVHLLLGTANLVFWSYFPFAHMLAMGYITTILHAAFVALQLAAAGARAGAPTPGAA
jgi:hypothetical protein